MKKRWHSLLGASVMVAIAVIWGSFWNPKHQVPKSKPISSARNLMTAPDATGGTGSSPAKHFVAGAPPTEAQTKQRETRWAQLFKTPIAVYGKVIDERGNPISDALVEIATVDGVQSTDKDLEKTDDDGLFSVVGKHGIGYSLRASKTGYYTTKQSTAHRNVLTPANTDSENSTSEHPTILVLHKQGITESLLVANTGQIDLPKNGDSVHVSLGREGQLEIASWVGRLDGTRFDWRYRITIPGGGLKERVEQFDFEAPVDGYLSSVEYYMPAALAQRWSMDGKKEYFARLRDGRFGRFSIRFYPSQGRNFVVVNSFINPAPGHRNLEFDATTSIKPPN